MYIITNTTNGNEYTPSTAETEKEAYDWLLQCTATNIRAYHTDKSFLDAKTNTEVIEWARKNMGDNFKFTPTHSEIWYSDGETYNIMTIYDLDKIATKGMKHTHILSNVDIQHFITSYENSKILYKKLREENNADWKFECGRAYAMESVLRASGLFLDEVLKEQGICRQKQSCSCNFNISIKKSYYNKENYK